MTSQPGPQIARLRCSPFHSSLDVDPIGSAACYDAYLCVEVPLPWQHDITMSEPFASLCDAPAASITGSDGRRWRPQGLVPLVGEKRPHGPEDTEYHEQGGTVQVTVWQQSPEAGHHVGPLRRIDWLVGPEEVEGLARVILASDAEGVEALEGSTLVGVPSALYVCSHGQRDVCCGSAGTELFGRLEMVEELDGIEVRRCSHTGGHRFAATAITFPDGYAWAHLDGSTAVAVAARSVHPRDLSGHLRGSTLLPSGPAQVADRHGLIEVGWEWADARRSVELLGFERRTMATDLRVTGLLTDGRARSFEVRVGIERHVPQITCGAISVPEYKVEPVWRVEASREVDPR